MKPIKLSDLILVLEMDSEEHVNRVDLETGRVVTVERSVLSAMEGGAEEELQDIREWQKEEVEIARAIVEDSRERFLETPDKFDFHEYRHMERFIETVQNAQDAEQLWRAIKGKGAFRYFKDTAHRLGLLKAWYAYREDAMKEFVLEWAARNHVPWEDDTRKRQ